MMARNLAWNKHTKDAVQRQGNAKPPEKACWNHIGIYAVVWAIWALNQGLSKVSTEWLKQLQMPQTTIRNRIS
jgi:hypothetical protein